MYNSRIIINRPIIVITDSLISMLRLLYVCIITRSTENQVQVTLNILSLNILCYFCVLVFSCFYFCNVFDKTSLNLHNNIISMTNEVYMYLSKKLHVSFIKNKGVKIDAIANKALNIIKLKSKINRILFLIHYDLK